MERWFKKAYILVLLLLVAAVVYIVQTPGVSNSGFDRGAAAEDITPFASYARGTVIRVDTESIEEFAGNRSLQQQVTVRITSGPDTGKEIQLEQTNVLDTAESVRLKQGNTVVLGAIVTEGQTEYVVVDRYRLPSVLAIVVVFMVLAIVLGRWRGVSALVGLGATGLVLLYFIAPQIISGKNAFLVSLVGAGLIVLITMFIAHGWRARIQLAALSTLVTLVIAAVLSWVFVKAAALFGLGQADAYLLETGFLGAINLKGVLLGGIIISVLGVLDDVTTSQTAAIEELHVANKELSWQQLYSKGLSIGREHIASLINTLILVYAGASLPLFLLFTVATNQPVWVLINSEYLAEEIVRALIGSMALIIAVPISTLVAAWYYKKSK